MTRFFELIDGFAGVGDETGFALLLDRAAFIFLILMVLACPHSIAASQTAWLTCLLLTAIRFVVKRRGPFKFRPLDIALWAFFGWSVISAAFSYSPAISFDSLRSVNLFLVFFVVAANIRTLNAAYLLAFALFFSCMVNVIKTPAERLIGRGIEIHGVRPDGPLGKASLGDGDTILKLGKQKISDPAAITRALDTNDTVQISMHRPDLYETRDIKRSDLLPGSTVEERLGIGSWGPSHYWRALGFFSHWTTYSEALMLIGSMVFGLLVAAVFYRRRSKQEEGAESEFSSAFGRFVSSPWFMALCFAGICVALLMTATRASQLSLLISGFVAVALSVNRKQLIIVALIALPIAAGGLILLERSRQIGFVDTKDESTLYRETMWRDGYRLLTASPRNFIFGIGMDSVKEHWREWGMYDNGRLPIGHFHSTPVQVGVERGVPALLIWVAIIAIYLSMIWRGLRDRRSFDWRLTGVLLGCFGGAIGFVTSGFVHNNLGDGEVAMIFYLMMGLGVRSVELYTENSRIQSERTSAEHI